jgi:hypothetical protein
VTYDRVTLGYQRPGEDAAAVRRPLILPRTWTAAPVIASPTAKQPAQDGRPSYAPRSSSPSPSTHRRILKVIHAVLPLEQTDSGRREEVRRQETTSTQGSSASLGSSKIRIAIDVRFGRVAEGGKA